MTLRHLKIFETVCAVGSITGAAEKLNMTQPAVSIAIKELEIFYDTKLFERMNRKLYITDSGRELRSYADSILERFEESVDVIRNTETYKNCRFGMNVSVGETYLAEITNKIRKEIPDIRLSVCVENSYSLIKKIAANELDFAVVDDIFHTENITQKLLFKEKMTAVCSADHLPAKEKISLKELASEKLLLREKGSGSRDCIDSTFYRHGYRIAPFLESSSTLAIINAAKNASGIAILPEALLNAYRNDKKLHRINIADDSFLRYYYLIYHSKKYLSDTVKTAIGTMQKIF